MLLKPWKMNNIEISVVDDEEKYEKIKLVEPNIICNRFDIKFDGDFELLKIKYNDKVQYIAYHIRPNKICDLGIYMTPLEQCVFNKIIRFLIKRHEDLKFLRVKHGRIKHRDLLNEIQWTLHLPDAVEEYWAQFSSKTRSERKRKRKRLMDAYDTEFVYYPKEKLTKEIVKRFFELKEQTEDTMYYKVGKDGIDERFFTGFYNITDAYAIKINGKIEALWFLSIVDDKNAYGINMTCNTDFKHYGLGIILYYYGIEQLIERKFKKIYLGGFYYDYKKESKATITETMKGDIVCSTPIMAALRFIFSTRKRFIYSKKQAYREKIITILGIRFRYKIK